MDPALQARRDDAPQAVVDWMAFDRVFRQHEGFVPDPGDKRALELFHYFTAGAHEEFMGRLDRKT